MKTGLSAAAALDRYFLETRCKIIEIAANLDRIERGDGGPSALGDPRVAKVREALGVLLDGKGERAERCQRVFSLAYEEGWKRPNAVPG
jgi:hypothetical protein